MSRTRMHVATFIALQRRVGNAAVSTLIAPHSPPPARPTASDGISVQRNGDEAEEPAGCGFCIDAGPAGTQAHNQVQARMGALGVDSEVKVAAGRGRGQNGRLDLARWDETVIEIGEIKPAHATGFAQGRSDLEFYKGVLEKTKNPLFKGKSVRMLEAPAPPPMIFDNPGVALPQPQMMHTTNVGGVYGYKCLPPNSDYFVAGGQLKAGDKHVTPDVLKAKKAFFDSDCIKDKTKRQALKEERVKVTDRTGTVRLVKPALAYSLLQSRAVQVKRELDRLSGEHHERHRIATQAAVKGASMGGAVMWGYGVAAMWDLAVMPDLGIWTAANSAASKCEAAKNLKELAAALVELDASIVSPRFRYLTYKGDQATQPNTPAPAAGAKPANPDRPPAPPTTTTPKAAAAAPTTTADPAGSSVDPVKIAALAGLVLLTFLILQPEIGAAAVAGAVGTGGAEAAGTIAASEIATGAVAASTEAALSAAAEEWAAEELLTAGAAAL